MVRGVYFSAALSGDLRSALTPNAVSVFGCSIDLDYCSVKVRMGGQHS